MVKFLFMERNVIIARILRLVSIYICVSGFLFCDETKVEIQSHGWKLIGDLIIPASDNPVPAVILLNKAAGDRQVYQNLAAELSKRGIASLRVDLRGHGESTNLGEFIPGKMSESEMDLMIWDVYEDVWSIHKYLKSNNKISADSIRFVGSSYSVEAIAESGRRFGYGKAYVCLSAGSFSEESIINMDKTGLPCWHIVSSDNPYLKEIFTEIKIKPAKLQRLLWSAEISTHQIFC